ncbi:N-acetylglucosamine-6-phosphate deacetylase [Azospirillaceae bacterium]
MNADSLFSRVVSLSDAPKGAHALVGAQVFTGDEWRTKCAVVIDGARIAAVTSELALPESLIRIELGGGVLAPGFIDLQVNGGGGVLFNDDPTPEAIRTIGAAHRRGGTTGFLPTLISDCSARRAAAAAAVRTARAQERSGVLGLHLEGPHLNPSRRGVHDARWLGAPTAEDMALLTALAESSGGAALGVVLSTMAPEVVSSSQIAALVGKGMRLAIGHSESSYEQCKEALAAGMSGFTHLFNAMSPLMGRAPGAVGAALDSAGAWVGVIADGWHVHEAALRLAWRCKGANRLCLTTDAMPPSASETKSFFLGDERILAQDGRCATVDGRLAGSCLTMIEAIAFCVRRLEIPLGDCLRMAAATPAEWLGIADRHGRIAPGLQADLVLLDDKPSVRATWVGGRPEPWPIPASSTCGELS